MGAHAHILDNEQSAPSCSTIPSPPEGWRYAVYTVPSAVLDGRLDACPPSAPFEEARVFMGQMLTRMFGGHYTLRWEEDKPGWWTGHVVDPAP